MRELDDFLFLKRNIAEDISEGDYEEIELQFLFMQDSFLNYSFLSFKCTFRTPYRLFNPSNIFATLTIPLTMFMLRLRLAFT